MIEEFIDFVRYEKGYGWNVVFRDLINLNQLHKTQFHIDRILEFAEKHKMKFTFFMTAKNLEKNKTILNKILNKGHEVGSHGYNHVLLVSKSKKRILNEFKKADAMFRRFGITPKGFRPPFLSMNKSVIEIAKRFNFEYVSSYYTPDELDYAKKEDFTLIPVIRPYDWEWIVVQRKKLSELLNIWRGAKGSLLVHPRIIYNKINMLNTLLDSNQDYSCLKNLTSGLSVTLDVY